MCLARTGSRPVQLLPPTGAADLEGIFGLVWGDDETVLLQRPDDHPPSGRCRRGKRTMAKRLRIVRENYRTGSWLSACVGSIRAPRTGLRCGAAHPAIGLNRFGAVRGRPSYAQSNFRPLRGTVGGRKAASRERPVLPASAGTPTMASGRSGSHSRHRGR